MDTEKKIRIDLSQAPWVSCEQDNKLFEPKLLFKRVSPLISPTGKEEFVPVEVMICAKCGKIPTFISDKLRDVPEELKSTCANTAN